MDGYKEIDSIKNNTKKITLYLNEKSKKLIVEVKMNGDTNYSIINVVKKKVEAEIKFSKYDEDYEIEFDEYNNLSIILNSNRYYVYSNCVIENDSYNYAKGMYININGDRVKPINEYRSMIEDSILYGKEIYYSNK